LLKLNPNLSSMWNDHSYNFDHSDQCIFRREKWRCFDRASGIKLFYVY